MAYLLYQGHGSYRLRSDEGITIYVDPYAGEGYDIPADIILVTHQHRDHNCTEIVPKADKCSIITNKEALINGKYMSFNLNGIKVGTVPAYNKMHKREECVGYIITLDGIKLYASGDTSATEEMKTLLPKYNLDYALLPIDGIYNMGATEASQCAKIIGAKHNIPVHMKPGELFDRNVAENFESENRLIVEPGHEIKL
jgi:L-ascorbate metabolism protein UlaG (beta-lactamase superfamily)